MRKQMIVGLVVLISALLPVGLVAQASAQMSSDNYQVDEAQFGSGASLEQCGTAYCAKSSLGDLTVGSGSSTNYSAQFGFNTSDEPMLEVTVTPPVSQDLGVLDVTATASTAYGIKVRTYLSNGYVMQLYGDPPKYGNHVMTTLGTPSTSQPGAEQFGVNLVDNSAPDIGADPVQVPDSTFSFGSVAVDYAGADLFKYLDGDVIAQSQTSSGETDYTLSMIMNISNVTPGGRYKSKLSAVVTSVF